MTKLFRYLYGCVYVSIREGSIERFFNLCIMKGIELWNIDTDGEKYCFVMKSSDFFRLRDIIRKTKVKIVIERKEGFPFLLTQFRHHQCFLVGMMLSFFILYVLSIYVWDITIDGNLIYSDEYIIHYLDTLNVHHGMFMAKVDCDYIETSMRKDFEEITWVSVEISGTRLLVHIKENDEDYIEIAEKVPCNLVAEYDGTVMSIITRAGTPLVVAGDVVTAGDVLVDSAVGVYNDAKEKVSEYYVHADADITIQTVIPYECSIEDTYVMKFYTNSKRNSYFCGILGKYVEVGWNNAYDNQTVVTDENQVKIFNNFYLPVNYGKKTAYEYEEVIQNYTDEEAKNILNEKLQIFLEELSEKGIQISEKNVKIEHIYGKYILKAEITIDTNAGIRKETLN